MALITLLTSTNIKSYRDGLHQALIPNLLLVKTGVSLSP